MFGNSRFVKGLLFASALVSTCNTGCASDAIEQQQVTVSPKVTVNRLDMLRELKEKFAKENTRLTGKKIKSLNQIAEQVYKTPTGAFLKYAFGGKDLEQSLHQAVKVMLTKIWRNQYKGKRRIVSKDIIHALRTNSAQMHKEVFGLAKQIIISSVAHPDHYVFYHGHGNSLRLYMDMMREISAYEEINNLKGMNPLRDKQSDNDVRTVDDIFNRWEKEAQAYAKENNKKLYDSNRMLGVGFAPDLIPFMRDNAISTNINLFGNMDCLAECTLFYFLDSFNISDPNSALIEKLVRRMLPSNATQDLVDSKVQKYVSLYNDTMKETGGNLMQIFVHKSVVNDIGFASWMKGIPVLLNKGHLATRGGNNRPVVRLKNSRKYKRPSMRSYIDQFTNYPKGFISKYSDFRYKRTIKASDRQGVYDRPQARLVIHPSVFMDRDLVKVKQFTRFKADHAKKQGYIDGLKALIRADMQDYINLLEASEIEAPKSSKLTRLIRYTKDENAFIQKLEANSAKVEKAKQITPKAIVKSASHNQIHMLVANIFRMARIILSPANTLTTANQKIKIFKPVAIAPAKISYADILKKHSLFLGKVKVNLRLKQVSKKAKLPDWKKLQTAAAA
ncbi:MAG: hypothetical protein ACPGXY_00105 [Alphaproteobacteria bacterium]